MTVSQCELVEVEGTPQQREKTLIVLNVVDAAPRVHIASRIPNQTSHTLWRTFAHGWLRWAGALKCLRFDLHRAQIRKEFFDQAEGHGFFVDFVLAEAHLHMRQVENHARNLRMMGNREMEDLDIDEAYFRQLLNELTDAKKTIWYNPMDNCRDNGFLDNPSRVPRHVLEDNSNLPLLELEGRFRKHAQYRHKCRMAAIEVEANTKIRQSLIGRSRPRRGDFVREDAVYYWSAGQGVHQSPGHWMEPERVTGFEGSNLWGSHGATAISAKEQGQMASHAEKELREMMIRRGAEDLDSRKTHGPPPRQQYLTGTATATTGHRTTAETATAASSATCPDACRQNNPHQLSNRVVEVLRLKLKESAKTKRARGMAPKPNVVPEQSMVPEPSVLLQPEDFPIPRRRRYGH